jgi:hypothetical protein
MIMLEKQEILGGMHSPWKEASNRLKYGGLFSEH